MSIEVDDPVGLREAIDRISVEHDGRNYEIQVFAMREIGRITNRRSRDKI